MRDTKAIEQFTNKWYTTTHNLIPELGTNRYFNFAGHSLELAYTSSKTQKQITCTIVDDAPAAFNKVGTNEIGFPKWYFFKEAFEKMVPEAEDFEAIAVATLNGSMLHEGLHIRFNEAPSLQAILTLHPLIRDTEKLYGDLYWQALNIFEDLYIEAHGKRDLGIYFKFIEMKNEIFFNEDKLNEIAALYDGSLAKALSLSVAFKNADLRETEAFGKLPKGAIELMNSVIYETMIQRDRAIKAAKFCRLFEAPENPEHSETCEGGEEGEDGKEGEGSGSKAKPSSFGENPTEAEAAEAKEAAEAAKEEMTKKTTSKIAKEFGEGVKAAERMIEGHDFSLGIDKPKMIDVMDASSDDDYVERAFVKPNFSFLRNLLRLKTQNHTAGEAKKVGAKIVNTRLYRIATDQKICAQLNSTKLVKKECEFIILVDASGSMGGNRAVDDGGNRVTLYQMVLSTAQQIFEAVRGAGISVSVYAHTSRFLRSSGGSRFEAPMIYKIARFSAQKSTTNNTVRFDKASHLALRENFDGLVIEQIAKEFTNKNGQRVLLVLSDGTPWGPRYQGSEANEHTKEVIKQTRKSGIGVFCMSLIDEVVRSNDYIYGNQYNVNATTNVQHQFEKIIAKIETEAMNG